MSSLVFLGISIILFIIVYGIIFLLVPQILGQFFSVLNNLPIANAAWQSIYNQNQNMAKFLVPLVPLLGLFLLILKVFMAASTKGAD